MESNFECELSGYIQNLENAAHPVIYMAILAVICAFGAAYYRILGIYFKSKPKSVLQNLGILALGSLEKVWRHCLASGGNFEIRSTINSLIEVKQVAHGLRGKGKGD